MREGAYGQDNSRVFGKNNRKGEEHELVSGYRDAPLTLLSICLIVTGHKPDMRFMIYLTCNLLFYAL